jgi:hypothetical protein
MSRKTIDKRKKKKPGRKKVGIMLNAYCTNKECNRLDFHNVVKAGTLCACGYPLSWLGHGGDPKKKKEPKTEVDNPA